MDTYNRYLESGVFPIGFVTLDQLPEIGEMTLVRTYPRTVISRFFTGEYRFDISREHRYSLILVMNLGQNVVADGEDFSGTHTGDLRYISTGNVPAHLYCGGFLYKYSNGVLSTISWIHDGYAFCLRFDNGIFPLTDETTPFVRDLLHTDTAERAMQTFEASMESWESPLK